MRTIKFRAKTINEDVWVYSMTIGHGTIDRKKDDLFMEIAPDKWKGIKDNTVSQFTGLLDCNGKEIYEGDIMRYYDDIEDELVDGVVEYSEDHCAFLVMNANEPIGLTAFWKFEVVGNIYDNPDLLTDKLNKQ